MARLFKVICTGVVAVTLGDLDVDKTEDAKPESKKEVSTTKPAAAKPAPVQEHAPQQLSDARQKTNTMQGLWSGTDLSSERILAIDHRLGHGFLRKVADAPAKLNVNVFGLQNSGADLLNAMLHINFGNQLNYYSGGSADASTNSRHGHWTHANIKEKWKFEKGTFLAHKEDNLHAIIMIRNPLSWLQAMRGNPQELEQCVSGDDWIGRPCTHKMPGGHDSSVPSQTYSSLAAIWNQWYDGFQNAADFGFQHRLVITYESLVRNPKGTMSHIGNFLGLKEPAQGWAMPSDSKDRDEAVNFMFTKRYMEQFTPKEKSQACLQLDRDLQRLYDYDDCEWTKFNQGQGARGGGEVHTGHPGSAH